MTLKEDQILKNQIAIMQALRNLMSKESKEECALLQARDSTFEVLGIKT